MQFRIAEWGDPYLMAYQVLARKYRSWTFDELVGQPDVHYPAEQVERPDAGFVRRRIERIMDGAASRLPREEPAGGWDALQTTLRMLRFHRWVTGWSDDARFFDVLAELRPSSFRATKQKWSDGGAAKEIQAQLVSLFEELAESDRKIADRVKGILAKRLAG